MFKTILARLQQGHRTMKYPDGPAPALSDRFRGRPAVDANICQNGCRLCLEACPTDAIKISDNEVNIDLGRCLFCGECAKACPAGAIRLTGDYRLAVRNREDLKITANRQTIKLAAALEGKMKKLFGRSLKLRQVSAGGCNACEADTNVLNTLAWDLGRFGIQFVASPRHADGLLITGPVTQNMKLALKKTYDAVGEPKIVIVVGTCAISGGPYIGHEQVNDGIADIVPVDLYIPGCPPHPLTILDGLLRLLDRKTPELFDNSDKVRQS
ncbi:MAG TPA: 4Fe-4S binding protein [Phycisphaerae bacterium]|nr:4Fe-4S binding protein [Phycisphaerae bacterium]HPS53232.1 4Fe-4S binding protein [Phycisphaerae bacterium]